MTFRILALPRAPFERYIAMTDRELIAAGAVRMIADTPNSAPCRVSLVDAEPGERLILLNHRHLDARRSPYRAEGPIFVREAARQSEPEPGQAPDYLTRRLLSARAYDDAWMMIDADVVEGRDLSSRLSEWLSRPAVRTVHLHTARRGCYLAAARRA